MANTENIEAKLAAYVDDELDAAGRAEIEKHLIANPQHRELIEELRQTREFLRAVPRVNAPPEIAEMLAAHLERAALLGDVEIGGDSATTTFSRWPQVRAIAAIIVLTVGLATVLYYILPSPKPTQTHVALVLPEPPAATSQDPRAEREVSSGGAPGAGLVAARDQSVTSNAAGAVEPTQQVFLFVDTVNPNSTNDEITKFLSANGISWQSKLDAERERRANKALNFGTPTTQDSQSIAANIPQSPDISQSNQFPSTNSSPNNAISSEPASDLSQQNAPGEIIAKMTNAEATQLCTALSQPKQRQSAKLLWPQKDELAKVSDKSAAEENRAKDETAAPELKARKQGLSADLDDPDRALAAGDTIRIHAQEKNMPGVEPVDETVSIDAGGFITLPTVGRVQAAGESPRKLASETIPQAIEQRKGQLQAAPMDLNWTIERTPAVAGQVFDKKSPVTQPVLAGLGGPTTEPNSQISAAATTQALETAFARDRAAGGAKADERPNERPNERVDVVIVLRAIADDSTNVPASAAPTNPAATTEPTQPAPAISAPAPTTLPTSPATEPTTAPSDR